MAVERQLPHKENWMKRIIAGVIVAACTLSFLALPTVASAKAIVRTLKCPSCGMIMSTRKTAAMPVPVRVHGVTYYCCAQCASGKAAEKAMHKHMMKNAI